MRIRRCRGRGRWERMVRRWGRWTTGWGNSSVLLWRRARGDVILLFPETWVPIPCGRLSIDLNGGNRSLSVLKWSRLSWQHHPISQYVLTHSAKVHRNCQSSDCGTVPTEALVVSTIDVSFVILRRWLKLSQLSLACVNAIALWCFPFDCQCVVPDGGDHLTFTSYVLALRSFYYIAWFIWRRLSVVLFSSIPLFIFFLFPICRDLFMCSYSFLCGVSFMPVTN